MFDRIDSLRIIDVLMGRGDEVWQDGLIMTGSSDC